MGSTGKAEDGLEMFAKGMGKKLTEFKEELKEIERRAKDKIEDLENLAADIKERVTGIKQRIADFEKKVKPGTLNDVKNLTTNMTAIEQDLKSMAKGF